MSTPTPRASDANGGGAAPPTAFPGTMRALREQCADAVLRAESFRRPLVPCALERCGGTCCTHGVTLNAEEALVVTQLVRRHGATLGRLVPDLPAEPIVRDAAGSGAGGARTARKPRAFRGRVADYPAHFPETACAFLGPTARCALQDLAVERGEAPWTYKPLACWLHPIMVSAAEIRLPDAATDPYPGGFASRTHCGRTAESGGSPAAHVLAAELAYLGRWIGRDLHAELRAAGLGPVAAPPAGTAEAG